MRSLCHWRHKISEFRLYGRNVVPRLLKRLRTYRLVCVYREARDFSRVRLHKIGDDKVKVLNVPGKRLDFIISFLHHKIREEKEVLKMGFALPNEWQKFVELEIDPTAFLGIANHRKYPVNEGIIHIGKIILKIIRKN